MCIELGVLMNTRFYFLKGNIWFQNQIQSETK